MEGERNIILVFGLPGAGKSTIINEVVKTNSRLMRLSGGSLIGTELTEAERDQLRKLESNQILKNQELLVMGFKKAVSQNPNKIIIFDGHCLVKDGNKIVEVPTHVIERLSPTMIIFINPTAEQILARRLDDNTRPDRELETIEDIRNLQNRQIAICKNYSKKLGVRLEILESPVVNDFNRLLENIVKTR